MLLCVPEPASRPRDVDHLPFALALADVGGLARHGVELALVVAVHRDEERALGAAEARLRSVAVVDVPVDDSDLARETVREQPDGKERNGRERKGGEGKCKYG